MKTKNFTSVGSLHPILFFAVMYLVALVFAIFICSTLFYSCNAKSTDITKQQTPVFKKDKAHKNLAFK
ncbi:MAG: hypothetical protein R2796_07915 [Chitinophagaceae bacterium]|nr:hypothetical protein [Chitinophagaceae bacterium]MCB0740704.1 hypothetical protein [Chitinophagaceae bacterium]HQU55779.1 hypothetical protein [Chitinophagaceae bacterium]HQV05433.1 hypothetical protein [Chitinophagaceae bacterium]